jgi:hypothetical protein
VVVSILQALVNFDNNDFKKHISLFYHELVGLMSNDLPTEIRLPLQTLFSRVGFLFSIANGLHEKSVSNLTSSPRLVVAEDDLNLQVSKQALTLFQNPELKHGCDKEEHSDDAQDMSSTFNDVKDVL